MTSLLQRTTTLLATSNLSFDNPCDLLRLSYLMGCEELSAQPDLNDKLLRFFDDANRLVYTLDHATFSMYFSVAVQFYVKYTPPQSENFLAPSFEYIRNNKPYYEDYPFQYYNGGGSLITTILYLVVSGKAPSETYDILHKLLANFWARLSFNEYGIHWESAELVDWPGLDLEKGYAGIWLCLCAQYKATGLEVCRDAIRHLGKFIDFVAVNTKDNTSSYSGQSLVLRKNIWQCIQQQGLMTDIEHIDRVIALERLQIETSPQLEIEAQSLLDAVFERDLPCYFNPARLVMALSVEQLPNLSIISESVYKKTIQKYYFRTLNVFQRLSPDGFVELSQNSPQHLSALSDIEQSFYQRLFDGAERHLDVPEQELLASLYQWEQLLAVMCRKHLAKRSILHERAEQIRLHDQLFRKDTDEILACSYCASPYLTVSHSDYIWDSAEIDEELGLVNDPINVFKANLKEKKRLHTFLLYRSPLSEEVSCLYLRDIDNLLVDIDGVEEFTGNDIFDALQGTSVARATTPDMMKKTIVYFLSKHIILFDTIRIKKPV